MAGDSSADLCIRLMLIPLLDAAQDAYPALDLGNVSDLSVSTTAGCGEGFLEQNSTCVALVTSCSPGTYASAGSGTCLSCPRGKYQPAAKQFACESCAGDSDSKVGATAETDCLCNKGYFLCPGSWRARCARPPVCLSHTLVPCMLQRENDLCPASRNGRTAPSRSATNAPRTPTAHLRVCTCSTCEQLQAIGGPMSGASRFIPALSDQRSAKAV